jgi:hypothetical protein
VDWTGCKWSSSERIEIDNSPDFAAGYVRDLKAFSLRAGFRISMRSSATILRYSPKAQFARFSYLIYCMDEQLWW